MKPSGVNAWVMAVLGAAVLLFAAAGTAVGGPEELGKALTRSKVKSIARKQAKEQIGLLAPGLSVASAQRAQSAQTADRPAVFAHVAANGQVDAANSEGITGANLVNSPNNGYYCFSALPFSPRGGSATVDWNGGDVDTIALLGLGENPECPVGTQVFVDIRKTNETGSVPTGFFVTLYR